MDNRSVAGCMDFNLLVDSFASPHSLLHVSSQLSDHTMATSGNRYVKLQDCYFSVCGFCFALQVNLKGCVEEKCKNFFYEPSFVDPNVISPTGVGRALISGLEVELSLAPFHCCNPWLKPLQQYPYQ
jgi:hypothetical protein